MVVEFVVLAGEDIQIETHESEEHLEDALVEAGPAITAEFIAFQERVTA